MTTEPGTPWVDHPSHDVPATQDAVGALSSTL